MLWWINSHVNHNTTRWPHIRIHKWCIIDRSPICLFRRWCRRAVATTKQEAKCNWYIGFRAVEKKLSRMRESGQGTHDVWDFFLLSFHLVGSIGSMDGKIETESFTHKYDHLPFRCICGSRIQFLTLPHTQPTFVQWINSTSSGRKKCLFLRTLMHHKNGRIFGDKLPLTYWHIGIRIAFEWMTFTWGMDLVWTFFTWFEMFRSRVYGSRIR